MSSLFLKNSLSKLVTKNTRHYWAPYALPKVTSQSEKWNSVINRAFELLPQKTRNVVADLVNREEQFAKLVRTVVGSKHPLMHKSKHFVYDTKINFQIHGLITLLLAKAAESRPNLTNVQDIHTSENNIWEKQTILSEVIELTHAQYLAHNSVLNLSQTKDGSTSKTLQSANGIAVLWGDYLAANASVTLASIRNPKVIGVMSFGVSDSNQAIFSGKVDKNGNMVPEAESPFAVWEEATTLEHAAILSRGCECMMILAERDTSYQENARDFGKNMALAIKVQQDIEDFRDVCTTADNTPFTLSLAPVIMHLQNDRDLLQSITKSVNDDILSLDFKLIRSAVSNGDAVEKASTLLDGYINEAIEDLNIFEPSPAKDILVDMLKSLEE